MLEYEINLQRGESETDREREREREREEEREREREYFKYQQCHSSPSYDINKIFAS